MNRITPFLWFDSHAEEAAKFYCSIFRNAKIKSMAPGPGNRPISVTFELDGQEFIALNGGPQFKFSEATSFFIACKDQEEIDHYWSSLTSDGGQEGRCGWLKDKYGLSWQVVPEGLGEIITSRAGFEAMMKMHKFDIAALKSA